MNNKIYYDDNFDISRYQILEEFHAFKDIKKISVDDYNEDLIEDFLEDSYVVKHFYGADYARKILLETKRRLEMDKILKELSEGINTMQYSEMNLILRLVGLTGLRIEEILKLKIKNYDSSSRVLTFSRKGGHREYVVFNTQLNFLIHSFVKDSGKSFSEEYSDDYIFSTQQRQTLYARMNKICANAGVNCTLNSLRKSLLHKTFDELQKELEIYNTPSKEIDDVVDWLENELENIDRPELVTAIKNLINVYNFIEQEEDDECYVHVHKDYKY